MDSLPYLDLDALKGEGPTLEELAASRPEELAARLGAMLRDFFRPGTLHGDLVAMHTDRWATPEEREAALGRVVQRVTPPDLRSRLVQQVPAALLLLADEATGMREIRFGEVVLREAGVRVRMAPVDLPDPLYLRWLAAHVVGAALGHLLGLPYPPHESDALQHLDSAAPETVVQQTDPILAIIEHDSVRQQITQLESRASPRQCELLRHLQEEISQRDLLPLLQGEQRRADTLHAPDLAHDHLTSMDAQTHIELHPGLLRQAGVEWSHGLHHPQPRPHRGVKLAAAKRMGLSPARILRMLGQLRNLAKGM
jgi:hypothetical protein